MSEKVKHGGCLVKKKEKEKKGGAWEHVEGGVWLAHDVVSDLRFMNGKKYKRSNIIYLALCHAFIRTRPG